MGSVRVTQSLMVQRTLNNLNSQLRKLFRLQDQLATGLKVNAPSDDPIVVRRAINTRTSIQRNDQYIANIESVGPQLNETTTSIRSVVSSLQRALELAVQGANGTLAQPQLDQIASEVNQLIEGILTQANHQTNDRYIFGGTRTGSPPFVATRDAEDEVTAVTYEGNDEYIRVAISDGTTVVANEPGSDAFFAQQDVFQLLIDIRDHLRAGDQASIQNAHLAELDTAMEQLLLSVARVGAVQNRLERSSANVEDFNISLQGLLSDTIDADYAETIMNLNAQSNAYQAALNAAARVLQPSLLDFVQ